jgi:fructose-bisphosphate aldolase class II
MIDNSLLEFKQNVANTTEVVEYAKKNGVSVEAELGALAGIEDNISVDLQESIYTNPDQAQKFVEDTKIDSLAVAIGTKHGPNKGAPNAPPKLDFERLTRIKMALGGRFPLVLHGASAVDSKLTELCNEHGGNIQNAIGIKDEDVLEAIRRGINKVNIDTDLRLAFLAGLRQSLAKFPDKLDIRKHMGAAREEMNVYAVRKIKLITTPGLG